MGGMTSNEYSRPTNNAASFGLPGRILELAVKTKKRLARFGYLFSLMNKFPPSHKNFYSLFVESLGNSPNGQMSHKILSVRPLHSERRSFTGSKSGTQHALSNGIRRGCNAEEKAKVKVV
jgi:hypothetical protein